MQMVPEKRLLTALKKMAEMDNRLAELQELVDRSAVYYNDTIRQVGVLAIQDYENLNLLAMLLTKHATVSTDAVRYPKEGT